MLVYKCYKGNQWSDTESMVRGRDIHTLDREGLIYICSDCEYTGESETLKSFGNRSNGFIYNAAC